MSKPCTICSFPAKRRIAVDNSLVEGLTYTTIATKYSSPERTVSRSTVARHALHALKAPEGQRLRSRRVIAPTVAPPSPEAGKTLLARVETLLLESQAIAAEAKTERQFISAVSALREVRCCIELLGKLNGEISSQNIVFANMDITPERTMEFLLAAEQRGPHIIDFMKAQFSRKFGVIPPSLTVNFIEPKRKDGDVGPTPAPVAIESADEAAVY